MEYKKMKVEEIKIYSWKFGGSDAEDISDGVRETTKRELLWQEGTNKISFQNFFGTLFPNEIDSLMSVLLELKALLYNKGILGILLLVLLFASSALAQTPPYVRQFPAVQVVPVVDYSDMASKLATAQAGDVILAASGPYNGNITMSRPDVLLLCDGHCIINGKVSMTGRNTWLKGFEVTTNQTGTFIDMLNADQVVVSNVVHGQGQMPSVGIGAWDFPNQIVAFNIVYNTQHLIYTQNAMISPKWIVGNAFLDVIPSGNSRTVHAYTQSPNKLENFKFHKDIVTGGQFLVGGEGNSTPVFKVELRDSILYKAEFAAGYNKRTTQLEITDNKFLKSPLNLGMHWGAGETKHVPGCTLPPPEQGVCIPLTDPSIVTGNTFYNPGGKQVILSTAAYTPNRVSCNPASAAPALRSVDIFNVNDYFGGFNNSLCANGRFDSVVAPIEFWRTKTESAGKKFDDLSTSSASAPPDGFAIIANEYDPDLALMAVWKFSPASSVAVSMPSAAALYNAKDAYGAPVVSLPAGASQLSQAAEFAVYLIRFEAEEEPCDLEAVMQILIDQLNVLNDPTIPKDKKIRQSRKLNIKAMDGVTACQNQ